MADRQPIAPSRPDLTCNVRRLTLLSLAVMWATLTIGFTAYAQNLTVVHTFSGSDGRQPVAGLTMDRAGNLYGTTFSGGRANNGTVFRLSQRGSGWIFAPLYSFSGGSDGAWPQAKVTIGPDGDLYGTTFSGGDQSCPDNGHCGVVFRLRPPARFCGSISCPWTETVIHSFVNSSGGSNPSAEVVFDQAGNLYGTTFYGANGCSGSGCGVVFELSPSQGGWTESVLHQFTGGDGAIPWGGVTFDPAGNIYGTTYSGGSAGEGTVYELSPSGGSWTEQVLHSFDGTDGAFPIGTLIFDTAGNLLGTTLDGVAGSPAGTVFQLSGLSGSWSFGTSFDLPGNGAGPESGLARDASGNLYGTTTGGGSYNLGTAFRLSPSQSGWTYTLLHEFTGGPDGAVPYGPLVLDASGNIYGTASKGGNLNSCSSGCGTVWVITP